MEKRTSHRMQSINWQGRHNSLSGKLMDDTLEKLHSNFGFDYGKLNGKNESFMSYYIFNMSTIHFMFIDGKNDITIKF